jgi:hypothetical protein
MESPLKNCKMPRVLGQMKQETLCCPGWPAPNMRPGTFQDSPFINLPLGSCYHRSPSSGPYGSFPTSQVFVPAEFYCYYLCPEGAASLSPEFSLTRQAALFLPQHPPKEVSAHIPDGQGHSLESLSPITPYIYSSSHALPFPKCLKHVTNSYPHLLPYLRLTSKSFSFHSSVSVS